ncbi:MAG: hypothetical protein KDB08_01230 [Microthrixaceae bacterium]|nr:hypothetical protein [Microthrixaceae bacterium]
MAVSLALAAAAMGGCAGPASPPPPEPAPLFASDEEAFAAAEATYRAYEDALNQVDLADPYTFEAVFDLTVGDYNARERKNLSQLHADGVTKTGESTLTLVLPRSVAGARDQLELVACRDVSEVALVDRAGVSMVHPARSNVQPLTVFLEGDAAGMRGLRVSHVVARDGEPTCGG